MEEWAWSSYPAYIRKVKAPNWLTLSAVEGAVRFNSRNGGYVAFVESQHDEAFSSIYNKKNMPAILGDKEFKEAVLQRAKIGDIQLSTTRGHEVNGHCAFF